MHWQVPEPGNHFGRPRAEAPMAQLRWPRRTLEPRPRWIQIFHCCLLQARGALGAAGTPPTSCGGAAFAPGVATLAQAGRQSNCGTAPAPGPRQTDASHVTSNTRRTRWHTGRPARALRVPSPRRLVGARPVTIRRTLATALRIGSRQIRHGRPRARSAPRSFRTLSWRPPTTPPANAPRA